MRIVNIGGVVHVTGAACCDIDCGRCGARAHSTVPAGGRLPVRVCETCDAELWTEAPSPLPAEDSRREPTSTWRRIVYPVQGHQISLLVVPVGSADAPRSLSALLAVEDTPMHTVAKLRVLADELEKLENDYTGKVDEALNKRVFDEIPF